MTLAGRLSSRVPPDSAVTNAAHRIFLGLRVASLTRPHERASRAVSRALRTVAIGRFSSDDRIWIDRIETRRRRLAHEHASEGVKEVWSPPRVWSIPQVWGRFLLRLVSELEPRSCIELGTGFGMSALYQASALEVSGAGILITLDQETSLIPVAKQGFAALGLDQRVELVSGPIGQTLGGVAERQAPVDYAFIDAEHTEAATTENFDTLHPHLSDGAVVVLDDIRESDEMNRAWATIQRRPGIIRALDMRRLGIVVVSANVASGS